MLDKKYVLAKAITEFKNSEQTRFDYMKLFIAANSALKQGSGLLWSDINSILGEVLDKGV